MDQLSGKQLRQRRARILRDQAKEYKEEQRIKNAIQSTQSSGSMLKVYLVIGAALVVTLVSMLQYTRPHVLMNLLGRSSSGGPKQRIDPYYMATFYPPSVVIDRDLPRFFRTFSIATQENEEAQNAVKSVIRSREALKLGAGRMKVWLKAWDTASAQQVVDRQLCGTEFTNAYEATNNIERRKDLIMWCLLTTRMADGMFLDSVQMIAGRMSPLLLAKKRGMVVRSSKSNDDDSTSKYLHSFYVHPRSLNYTSTFAILPSKVIHYLLDERAADQRKDGPEQDITDYRDALQEQIFQLVHSNGNAEKYLELQEVCQPAPPPMGAIAEADCDEDGRCCYYVLPEVETQKFLKRDEEGAEMRRSLRENTSSEGTDE